jgi:hypothetical protein
LIGVHINSNIDLRMIYYKNISIAEKQEELKHLKRVLKEEKAKQKNFKYWINYLELSINMIEGEVNLYNFLNDEFIDILQRDKIYLNKHLMSNICNFIF